MSADFHVRRLGVLGDGRVVWIVDDNLVKLSCDPDFQEGSNPEARSYVPDGELWISDQVPPERRKYVLLHELTEAFLMKSYGWSYEKAHEAANNVEMSLRAKTTEEAQ